MRDFLDAILAVINAESLTDWEFEHIDLDTQAYNQATYDELKALLELREAVSTQVDRLTAYFTARGVSLSNTEATPQSNIFVGAPL